MKSLSDFIKEIGVKDCKRLYEIECYSNSMKDFFGDILPDKVLESMYNEEYKDFILESLTSHDPKKLKEKIESEFTIKVSFTNKKEQSLDIFKY